MSGYADRFPSRSKELSEPTKRDFVELVELLADTPFGDADEAILAGPWPTVDGRKLSVYKNINENHTSSHEVTVTDIVVSPTGEKIEIDTVYARPYYGEWTKEVWVHDIVEKRHIELSLPSWEVNPVGLDPSLVARAAEEDRQAYLFALDMARADNEGFGLSSVDEDDVIGVNHLMRGILSGGR